MAFKSRLWFFTIVLTSGFLQAQQKDSISRTKLDEVRISSLHINDSLLNAPASIGVLSEKDLQRNNTADITPAINSIAGVLMQSGSYNTNRISIRGIGARTPYGTNKIRAFYGAIPLTSGDSETTIEDLDIENIRQVEIIKGPLSSLYGAGLGGAILLTPKIPGVPGSTARISSTHGSYGLLKNSIGYSLDKKTFDQNPRSAAVTWKNAKGFEQYDSYLGGISYEAILFSKLKNVTSIFINHKESDEPRPFDILKQNTTGYGARTQFSGDFGPQSRTSFIIGLEYFRDNFKGRTFENRYQQNNNQGSLQGNQLTETTQNRTFYNGFVQLRTLLSNQFEIQAGVNINQTQFDLDNILLDSEKEKYRYDAIVSPQISILFQPSKIKTIYASVSRGFSTPAIEETLNANGTINPNIKPENGYNLELGAKCYFLNKTLYTEIAAYRMEIQDLLVAQRIGDDQYVGVNAGKTLHQGIEFSANYTLPLNKTVSINPFTAISIGDYTFKEFNTNGNDFSGNRLTGVPKNKINAGVLLNTNFGVYFSTDYQYVAEIPLNDANTAYNDSYRIWNLKTGYKFEVFKGFTSHIAAGINNVFDEHYASMVLVNAVAVGNGTPRFYYPGMPINYYANLSFSYQF